MLRHPLVVAAEDLDADTLGPKRGDGRPGACFWRIEEDDETGKNQISFIGHSCPRTVGLELAPGDAERAKSLRAESFEDLRRAGPRRVVERQKLRLAGLFILAGELDDVFGSALGDQQAAALVLDEDRNAAALKVERHHVDLGPARTARRAGFDDRGIERVPQSGLEMAVEPSQVEHALAAGARERNLPREPDLGFGERPGLVRAQHVHAAQVMDRAEPFHDHLRLRHADGAPRERHRDDHRQEFGREPDSESHGEQEALQPGPVEQQVDQQHKQHEDLGQANDQHAESVGALFQGGGRWRSPQAAADLAELGCQAGAADHQPGRAVHHRAAHEGGVGRLGDFRAVDTFFASLLLRRVGFAGQQCLVDEKIPGLEETPIRRDQIAGGQQHDIARDEILPRHRNLLPVTQDLLLERHRDLEMLGCLLGAVFLHGVESRTHQHDC